MSSLFTQRPSFLWTRWQIGSNHVGKLISTQHFKAMENTKKGNWVTLQENCVLDITKHGCNSLLLFGVPFYYWYHSIMDQYTMGYLLHDMSLWSSIFKSTIISDHSMIEILNCTMIVTCIADIFQQLFEFLRSMSAMAYQITKNSISCSTTCSG